MKYIADTQIKLEIVALLQAELPKMLGAQQDAILAGFRIDPRQLVGFIAPWTVHFGMARGVHEQLRRPDLGIADGETLWQFGKVGVGLRRCDGAPGGLLSGHRFFPFDTKMAAVRGGRAADGCLYWTGNEGGGGYGEALLRPISNVAKSNIVRSCRFSFDTLEAALRSGDAACRRCAVDCSS